MRATIKLKLGLTFAVIILLSATMAWIGINRLASLDEAVDGMIKGPVERALMESELYATLLRIVRAEKNMIMADTPDAVGRYDAEIMKERAQFLARLEKLTGQAEAGGPELSAAPVDHCAGSDA